jgi:hypothetical protein
MTDDVGNSCNQNVIRSFTPRFFLFLIRLKSCAFMVKFDRDCDIRERARGEKETESLLL